MAPKRSAAAKAAGEPAAKKREVEKIEPAKEGEPKAAEPPAAQEPEVAEKEADAPADKRAPLKAPVDFPTPSTTLNVVPMMEGRLLRSLTDGGMQYLIAGARAGVGIKAGRYMFEVKILEALPTNDRAWGKGAPKGKQLVRLGFSAAGSPLVLGDNPGQVFFDSEGAFHADGKASPASKRFARGEVIAVVLNLDPKSPNANTVSLFRNGQRLSQPQALPEGAVGKALFPHVAFRNVTLQVNMGPSALSELPFKCRMLGGAAQADVEVAPSLEAKDGKCDVLLPVGYPDEGTFDWLDDFLAKNPSYVELSSRKIIEWAVASGVWKPKASGGGSNDRPNAHFGVPLMDDSSIKQVLDAVSPVVPRNYVVMEVRGNLMEAERKKVLERFGAPHFKKTACVFMGEPPKDFAAAQHAKMLKTKQLQADTAWRLKKAEEERKKAAAEKAKKAAEARKKAEEAKKAAEEAKKDPAAEGAEAKEEEKEEKAPEAEAMEVEAEGETEPPKVELSEEEKQKKFAPSTRCDVDESTLAKSFAEFSIPQNSEGFDAIRFEWEKEAAAKRYLHAKVLERKRTSVAHDLKPSQWFQDSWVEFKKRLEEWQKKQESFKKSAKAIAAKKAAATGEAAEEGIVQDLFSVEDVSDIGDGEPLFKDFELADWALVQLRFELWKLQLAFKKDLDDPDRPAIALAHFPFYFQKYFNKILNPKAFGAESVEELTKMVKDAASWEDGHLTTSLTLDEDHDGSHFVKVTEEARRERQRRIDAGDETARLKIQPVALNMPPPAGSASASKLVKPKDGGKQKMAPKTAPAGTVTPPAPPKAVIRPGGSQSSSGKGFGKKTWGAQSGKVWGQKGAGKSGKKGKW